MQNRKVIILGGGLAGISTAVALIRNGVTPMLIERRPFLGGRAFSFTDRYSGEQIDNGQHVILGACSEYLELIDTLGVGNAFDLPTRLVFPVVKGGYISYIRAGRLLGNASALLGYRHLSMRERMSALRCLLAMKFLRMSDAKADELMSVSMDEWLKHHRQSVRARRVFWNLFMMPVFNSSLEDVAAYDAIVFIKAGLLRKPVMSAIGAPRIGLSSISGTPASKYMAENNGELIMGDAVGELLVEDSGVRGVILRSGRELRGDVVVSTLPPHGLEEILPNSIRSNSFFAPLKDIETASIVGVNIWYESQVMDEKYIAVLDSELQWVFNLSRLRGVQSVSQQHLAVSISNADKWMHISKQDIADQILGEMARVFPAARITKAIKSTVVKSREATICIKPGSHHTRLSQHTPISGLVLAGDWTDTGMPATMEGAVRSGNLAAEESMRMVRCE